MSLQNVYVTKDLGIAAMLLTKSIPLKSLHFKDRTAYFVFDTPDQCLELSHSYLYGECMVNAKPYNENLRTLKRQIQEMNGHSHR